MFKKNLIVKVVAVVITYAQTLFLARFLTTTEFGLWSALFAAVNIFCTIALLGFPQLIQRNYRRESNVRLIQAASYSWLKLFTILSISLLIFNNFIEQHILKIFFLISVLCISIVRLKAHALFGEGLLVTGQCADILLRPLIFILILLTYAQFEGAPQYTNVFIIFTVSSFATLVCLRHPFFKINRVWVDDFFGKNDLLTYMKQGLPFFLISFVQMLSINIWIILISKFQSPTEAGIFRIAFVICLAFGILREIIDMISRNKIIDCYQEKNSNDSTLMNQVTRVYKFGAITLSIAAGIYFLWGNFFIISLFGSQYEEAFFVSLPLIFARIIECFLGPFPFYLQVNGHERIAVIVSWSSFLLSATLYLAFYETFGLISASVAFLILTSVLRITTYLYYKSTIINKA